MGAHTGALTADGFVAYARHVNPTLAHLLALSGRDQHFVHAQDNVLTTDRGERYKDWIAGFGSLNLGHNPPRLLEHMRLHLSENRPNLYVEGINPFSGRLAQRLVELAGPSFETCFFCNSGTEAVEAAIKLAIAATRRRDIVYCEGAYHGTTTGSLSMVARGTYRDRFEPLLPQLTAVPFDDLGALTQALAQRQPAAFVLEPIQVESGVRTLSATYMREARRLCDEHGTLLVLDEVQTGMGRTGSLFAFQQQGIAPDIVALAKALGGGVVPLGAIIIGRGQFQRAYGDYLSSEVHNSTFGGNALSCSVGLEALSIISDPNFLETVRQRGAQLMELLHKQIAQHPLVRRVSITGLLGGVELHPLDHPWFSWQGLGLEGMDHLPVTAALLTHRLHKRRILTQVCGHDWSTLRIEPPLTVSLDDCREFVATLAQELDWIHERAQ
jgi:putrescine aminotransferase